MATTVGGGKAANTSLLEHFVVCGLSPTQPLRTVHGEGGFLGHGVRYQAAVVDSAPVEATGHKKLPPQLPTVRDRRRGHASTPGHDAAGRLGPALVVARGCAPRDHAIATHTPCAVCPLVRAVPCLQCCLPGGIEVVPRTAGAADAAQTMPRVYSVVLTGGCVNACAWREGL